MRRACPRLLISVDEAAAVREGESPMQRSSNNIFNKSRSTTSQNQLSDSSHSVEMGEGDSWLCGPNDERMSWGLHFYEQ